MADHVKTVRDWVADVWNGHAFERAESYLAAGWVGRENVSFPERDRYNNLMTRIVTATEAKAKILSLLDEVSTGDEVQITKHGHVVARLVPAGGPRPARGSLADVAVSVASEDELFTTGVSWNAQ